MRIMVIIVAVLCFATVLILKDRITGGRMIEDKVEAVVKTNKFLIDLLGGPISVLKRSDAPSRVELKRGGLRQGSFSFWVEGIQTNGHFKIDWTQLSRERIEIRRISLRAPLQQNKVLWENTNINVPDNGN